MNTQTLTKPAIIGNLVMALLPTSLTPVQPILASSRDYGFDFDEEELAKELLAPLPTNLSTRSISETAADEFESCYIWFTS
jgi:hypothetical protein